MLKSVKYRHLLHHILCWAIFIFYEVSLITLINPNITALWEWMIWYALNIGLFYFFAHVVLHNTLKYNRLLLVLALVPVIIGVYILLQFGIEKLVNPLRDTPRNFSPDKIWYLRTIWRCFYFLSFSTAYWFVRQTIENQKRINQMRLASVRAEREKVELEKGLVRSQNALLQAQISPHLLFNTLNFIYNSVQDVSPKASQGVLLLSEVMHYALQRVHEDGKTELQHEVEHIEKYIALNQLRFSYPLHLQMKSSGRLQGRIPPLLLLTFVENTFKHGDLTDPGQAASISISNHQDVLHFSTSNKKRKHYSGRGYGIGIQNARTRLSELYNKQDYSLTIDDDGQRHAVYLKIKLT